MCVFPEQDAKEESELVLLKDTVNKARITLRRLQVRGSTRASVGAVNVQWSRGQGTLLPQCNMSDQA